MNSISNSKQANRDLGHLLNIHIELLKARRKHPLFAHCLVSDRDKANAAIMLRNVRQTLHTEIESGNAAAVTVLLCEVCEAVDSLAKEDFKNALVELAQVCAVSIRTMEAIENEVKHKEAFAHAEKCRSEGVPCKLKGCEFYDDSQEQCCGGALGDETPLVSVCEKYVGLPPVLDACCGSRMFWFDRSDKRAVFVDKRRERHTVKDKSSRGGSRELIIDPDYVADFTALPFNSGIFALVVFDPPHFQRNGASGWMAKKYGTLKGDWREELRQGFAECFRVLKPNGVLIFKWCSYEVPLSQILALTPERPLFGHRSGKQQKTHWVTFMKPNRTITMHK